MFQEIDYKGINKKFMKIIRKATQKSPIDNHRIFTVTIYYFWRLQHTGPIDSSEGKISLRVCIVQEIDYKGINRDFIKIISNFLTN